ncbi:MAG: zinc ribbon domain-containing protein [Clostridiales bacterium]|nr:zinc ribbon domain-containing protein [Clostridiales bacterium]
MNSSNSFNICPRCGNSNALNAKYCSRCGGQLKVPEEPVVCHKCHTHNTPMANFCRNCGTALKVGSETKICPRCGKEVRGEEAICQCGYSFVTYQQTMPSATPVDVSELKDNKAQDVVQDTSKADKKKSAKNHNRKGGRGWAIAGLILVLLFAYYIVAPFVLPVGDGVTLRPEFLVSLDNGLVKGSEAAYGYDIVSDLVTLVQDVIAGKSIGDVIGSVSVGYIMVMVLVVIYCVTAAVHLLVCFIRCFTGKRSKRMNIYFLIMAIISILVVGLMILFKFVAMPDGVMSTIASWFALGDGISVGYALCAIPVYFWFFFFYSLGAKAKKVKEPVIAE